MGRVLVVLASQRVRFYQSCDAMIKVFLEMSFRSSMAALEGIPIGDTVGHGRAATGCTRRGMSVINTHGFGDINGIDVKELSVAYGFSSET